MNHGNSSTTSLSSSQEKTVDKTSELLEGALGALVKGVVCGTVHLFVFHLLRKSFDKGIK